MPNLDRITIVLETRPDARAQVQVSIPTPRPGMRLETAAHALAIDALGWLGRQPAVAGFVYGGEPGGTCNAQQKDTAPDWQIQTLCPGFVIEVDCNSGTRRRVYSDGQIEEIQTERTAEEVSVDAWRQGARFALEAVSKVDSICWLTDSMKVVCIEQAGKAVIAERDRLLAQTKEGGTA